FFSSRRRHTRSKRDWSSDVCSSDLVERLGGRQVAFQGVEEFAGLLGLFTAGHNSVDQLTPTGEVLGCWCGLWCRLASHCPEVIAEMGEAVNPVVLDVPPVGGGVVATVER